MGFAARSAVIEREVVSGLQAAGCGIVRKNEGQALPPAYRTIVRAVSSRTGITVHDILSPRKSPSVARARMLFYFFVYHATSDSLTQIGEICARHHSTVLNGIRRASESDSFEPERSQLVRDLKKMWE